MIQQHLQAQAIAPSWPTEHGARGQRTLELALSIIAALFLLRSVWFVYANAVGAPFQDLWYWIGDLERWQHGGFTWRALFAPWMEHRIATTRLLLWADARWFQMRGVLPVAASFLLFVASGLVWARTCRPGLLPPLFWMAWFVGTNQRDNLLVPFQVQFAIAIFCAVSAFALLASASGRARASGIARALAASAMMGIGIVSMASVALAAPAALLILLLRRAPPSVWLAWSLPTAAAIGAALLHHSAFLVAPSNNLADAAVLGAKLAFVAAFLSGGLFTDPAPAVQTATVVGTLLIAAAVAFGIRCCARRRATASEAMAIAAIAWPLLCAMATTVTYRLLGGTDAALAGRYATMSLLFLAGLLVLLTPKPHPVRSGGYAIVAIALLAAVNRTATWTMAAQAREAADLVANNVAVSGRIRFDFGTRDVGDFRPEIAMLASQKLSLFAPARRPSPGALAAIGAADAKALPRCAGSLDTAFRLDAHAIQVIGWLATPALQTPDWIVPRDGAARVLGAWRAEAARPDVVRATGRPLAGFANAFRMIDSDSQTLSLFGLVGKHPVCILPAPIEAGPLWFAPLQHVQRMEVLAPTAAVPLYPEPCSFCDANQASLPSRPAGYAFEVTAPPPGRALGVAFRAEQGEVRFRFGNAAPIVARIPPFFGQGGETWRVALLPLGAALAGPVHIELVPDDNAPLQPGAVIAADIDPDWSKLF